MINESLLRLWKHIDHRRRKSLLALLCLLACGSLAEVVTIGAIIPFLAALTDPVKLYSNPNIAPLAGSLGITDPYELILPVVIIFGLAALLSGIIRLMLLFFSNKIAFSIGHDLSVKMYNRSLFQPYATHIGRNSSEVINAVSVKSTLVIFGIVSPCLLLINAVMMIIVILIFLITIDPFVTLILASGFVVIYVVIMSLTTDKLKIAGEQISVQSTVVLKAMQEGLGAIRDIIIDGSQRYHSEFYRVSDLKLRTSQRYSQVIREAPRYVVESLGLVLIASVAYMASKSPEGVAETLPVLGALALGCQRMLPVIQNAYSSWGSIKTALPSLADVVDLLEQPIEDHQVSRVTPIQFKKCLSFRDVKFNYSQGSPIVLTDINLDIKQGSRVGIIGSTGCGKSTLLDVIMGLLRPTGGMISVDGVTIDDQNIRAWQRKIGHVPQFIFLSDATIAENIAFGVSTSKINYERVKRAAEQAQLADAIESWPEAYQTRVGERGVKLSGGQRQRIGIARALYKKPDLIVFDEATSALDNDTEASVMNAIRELSHDLTVVMVAHRLSTLEDCDLIFEVKNGRISMVKES